MPRKRSSDTQSLPVADPALKHEIQHVLASGSRMLRFPAHLENYFIHTYRALALNNLMASTPYLLFLFLLLGVLSFGPYSPDELGLFTTGYLVAGLCLLGTTLLVHVPRFDHLFHWYTGLFSMVALACLMTVAASLEHTELCTAVHAAAIYAVIIVYAMAKMRFYATVFWCVMAGLLHLAGAAMLGIQPSIQSVEAYLLGANLIGGGITYIIEHRERTMFLQKLLLDIDKVEQAQLYANLEKLSREDPLTGLANRRFFDERLNLEWNRCQREKQPLSLVLLDVDHFKQYNDLYGHQAGDHCLTLVARALRKEASRPAELVGRYGGEEFIILYPNIDAHQLKNTLVRIQQRIMALAIPHEASQVAPVVTVSLGAATVHPVKTLNPEKLVSAADQMLYKSKQSGRNCWFNTVISHCEPQQQNLINLS